MPISQNFHTHLPNWTLSSKIWLFAAILLSFGSILFSSCHYDAISGVWAYEIILEESDLTGTMNVDRVNGSYSIRLVSIEMETKTLENVNIKKGHLTGDFYLWGDTVEVQGDFLESSFKGIINTPEEEFVIQATRQSEKKFTIDRSGINYLLESSNLPDTEKNIDHAGIIRDLDRSAYISGSRIYNSNCINCHGTPDIEGSIPLSHKFWKEPFKAGSDAYSMYQTLTRGYGSMPPQFVLTPQEKYNVILYVQENFVKKSNVQHVVASTPGYLEGLPKGTSRGPDVKPYHPWSDMDYGNFFINTYELVDAETGPPRYHSPGPSPFPDEDYSANNFAYKGIAVRLDSGAGGVSDGKAFMIFDHDLMRVAGGWSGGFIDWDGILLNDRHETYPRTLGKLHFETPVAPAWANPSTGTFDDPRFTARDGRQFGPLPKEWADYKGIYHFEDQIVISYSVGNSDILEQLSMEMNGNDTVFVRTLNVSPSSARLRMRVAGENNRVAIAGTGAELIDEEGYKTVHFQNDNVANIKIFIAASGAEELHDHAASSSPPQSLVPSTRGGKAHFPQELTTTVVAGLDDGPFSVDQLTPPFDNPWESRMKLSGIDFMEDESKAAVCTVDGDIWMISGLNDDGGILRWQRIGAGLFQPLGIKVLNDDIYVICRDQLVLLEDFNGDGETDFYKSYNHDHQVTDHFHEFAMGLQADNHGNLYYAKSGRHAREALIPQHGTLLKVHKGGAKTEIIASGFRAANGVCINPDGSFIVTDQQGYWNPMNRINWISGKDNFYGNMWGYNPPADSSRSAMEPPMVWVDMEYDRSPSELVWVESEKWGPLNGSLLSFSYGYGKIQLVLHENVAGQMQGGVIDLPGVKFLTGVMRGRFNKSDGHLYACGMSAWGTSQLMKGGDLYRIRYTGKTLTVPVSLKVLNSGIELSFTTEIDPLSAEDVSNFTLQSWDLIRSRSYGSDRHNIQTLNVSRADILHNGKTIRLRIEDINPVDVMTINYSLVNSEGDSLNGSIQNTIHNLPSNSSQFDASFD